MLDRLTSMNAFVKAVDCGSFAAAAVLLGLSPQMVAKHVLFLEDRVGARLLNRTTRRQSLTELGGLYYERCKLVLAEAEAADALAADMKAVPRGRLRISAPVTFGTCGLVPMITAYLRAQRQVELSLTLTDRFVDLVDEGYEAAFRIGPLSGSALVALPLAPYQLIVCAAPDYLRQRGRLSGPTISPATNASATAIGQDRPNPNGILARWKSLCRDRPEPVQIE